MARADTIVAVASPRGPGRRAVLRVSGPEAGRLVMTTWCGSEPRPDLVHRGFHIGRFNDGGGQQPSLVLWMPGPHSFTREDVAEFHLPGSPPLVDRALERLLELGARSAHAGEFTRRAFENGRIDLTRAEGVLALVHARGEAERRSASALLFGGLDKRLRTLREGLEALRALAEASLDFDESDTGHVEEELLLSRAREVLAGLREAAQWEERRAPRGDLPEVVLVGEPNAGKSSLFNLLAHDAEALVSDVRGTTRDVIGGIWELPGGPVRLYDTAGLDTPSAGPDADAQAFARRLREDADLLLWVVDASVEDGASVTTGPDGMAPRLLVWNKCDAGLAPKEAAFAAAATVAVSAKEGRGLETLASAVEKILRPSSGESGAGRLEREIGARHRDALNGSARALEGALRDRRAGAPLDLFAEGLRGAGARLDEISGRTTAEDLLDQIFGQFCIGK